VNNSRFVRIVDEKVGYPTTFYRGQVVAKSLLPEIAGLLGNGSVEEVADADVPANAIHGEDTITPIVSTSALVTTGTTRAIEPQAANPPAEVEQPA
jgi:hypothetical protein